MIVVDASALLEVLLHTPAAAVIRDRLFSPDQTLHAPHLIDVEVAQVLRRYAASGRVEPGRCRDALDDLFDFPLDRYPHDLLLRRVWELRHNITAYDAVYVALAEALNAPLLTRNRRLAAAAGIERGSSSCNTGRAAADHAADAVFRHEVEGALRATLDRLPAFDLQPLRRRHQRDLLEPYSRDRAPPAGSCSTARRLSPRRP